MRSGLAQLPLHGVREAPGGVRSRFYGRQAHVGGEGRDT